MGAGNVMKWRKSSYSANASDCVELAVHNEQTAIRDTKNRTGGSLSIAASQWLRFLETIKDGEPGDSRH
jgi:hypothetical protein